MIIAKDTHKGWDTDEHLELFNQWNLMGRMEFLFKYGCFREQNYLNERISSLTRPEILDYGCATGTTYRFLKYTNT